MTERLHIVHRQPMHAAQRKTTRPWAVIAPAIDAVRLNHWLAFWLLMAVDVAVMHLWLTGAVLQGCAVAVVVRGGVFWIRRRASRKLATSVSSRALVAASLLYIGVLAIMLISDRVPSWQAFMFQFPSSPDAFESVTSTIDQGVDWMTSAFAAPFMVLTQAMNALLNSLESALRVIPWPASVAVIVFAVWRKGGAVSAAFTLIGLLYIGIFGFWEKTVSTAALVLAAFLVCLIAGIPLGIAAAKSRTLRACIMPCLDIMQTMPSFVYLLPAVAFFSIGKPPALVATVIFSMPPLIRLTCLGLSQVSPSVKEAMYAHGATGLQTLIKAELPLAAPSIQAGINQSIMMSLSMVVVAALIGGGGLGYDVLFALQNVQYGHGILAGLAIVFCAIVFDRLMRAARQSTPPIP